MIADSTPAGIRVAVVDDDPPVRKALTRLLSSAGYHVTAFGSAEDFLDACSDDPPACVLLDVHLPQMGGVELERHLREGGLDVAVVLITADHELAQSERMTGSGVRCLVKPLDENVLLAAVSGAIGHG